MSGLVGGLISSCERERGHVVVLRNHVHEILYALQDVLGEVFGRGRSGLQDALDSLQTKFRVLRLGLYDSAGDHRQRSLWSQADDAGIGRGERKQPERQAGGGQLDEAGVIAQQAGGVACIHVAHRAQFFVVATGESGATAHASGRAHDLEIQTA